MKVVLILLILGTQFGHSVWGQNQKDNPTDSIVSLALSLSEKALYDARFEEAKEIVKISYYKKFSGFNIQNEILLTIQNIRIDGFANIVFLKTSDNKTNFKKLSKFLSDTTEIEDKGVLSQYLLALSDAYRSIGIMDSAVMYQEKALLFYHEEKNFKKIAEIRAHDISIKHNQFLSQGNKKKILELIPKYKEEIAFSKLYNKYALAYNTRHLAQIYRRQTFDFEEALELFKMSLNLRLEIGFKPFLPASYSSLGDVYMKMNEDALAIEMYIKSSEIAEEISFVRYESYPFMQIGDIYLSNDQMEKAFEFYIKALKLASENNYSVGINQSIERIKKLNMTKNKHR
jgi:tetratricopeptide (TPR) repeat protein